MAAPRLPQVPRMPERPLRVALGPTIPELCWTVLVWRWGPEPKLERYSTAALLLADSHSRFVDPASCNR